MIMYWSAIVYPLFLYPYCQVAIIMYWSAIVSPLFLYPHCQVYESSCISCKIFCKLLHLRNLCKVCEDPVAS